MHMEIMVCVFVRVCVCVDVHEFVHYMGKWLAQNQGVSTDYIAHLSV